MLTNTPASTCAYPALLKAYGHLLEPKRSLAVDAVLRKSRELEPRGPLPAIEHMLKTYGHLVRTDDPLLKGGAGSGWRSPEHGGTHAKRAPHEEGKDGGGQPNDFVTGPHGSIDFGEISAAVAKKIGRQLGSIRLPRGIQNADGTGYGLIHIEASHGKQIRGAGFTSVEDFVRHVALDFSEVWQASGRQLLVAVRDGKQHMMYVQLEPATDGDYYRVNTAFPVRQLSYPERHKFKPLWDGSEPASAATGKQPAFASGPGNDTGQVGPNARGNVSDSTIPKPSGKAMSVGEQFDLLKSYLAAAGVLCA